MGDTGRQFSQTRVVGHGQDAMGHAPFSEAISQGGEIYRPGSFRVCPSTGEELVLQGDASTCCMHRVFRRIDTATRTLRNTPSGNSRVILSQK